MHKYEHKNINWRPLVKAIVKALKDEYHRHFTLRNLVLIF